MSHEWLKDIPYDILDSAFHDLIKARSAIQAKNKNQRQKGQSTNSFSTFHFRSRRDPQQVLEVRKRWWNLKESSKSQFASLFGPRVNKCRVGVVLPETLETDVLLRYDRLGRYFWCIPQQIEPQSSDKTPTNYHSTIALDPGVRTFQTCYDADGMVMEWGAGDMNGIFRLCYNADKIQIKVNQAINYQQRRRRRKALYRINEKIRNRVKELHCKLAVWLCSNYKVILLPKFKTQNMIRRGCRKLRSKTARAMCTWSHYKFQQVLLQKSQLYPWCKVIICDESYTSKTCGQCGTIHSKLGGNKVFKCPSKSCNYQADRDVSASRNILLRYLTLFKV